jgi:putative restriction endonuclease
VDLQGAHVVPVRERGRDVLENGLALCARHHWAFDNGLFTLSDAREIEWLSTDSDPHNELVGGATIRAPTPSSKAPDPFYLAHHRAKWKHQ